MAPPGVLQLGWLFGGVCGCLCLGTPLWRGALVAVTPLRAPCVWVLPNLVGWGTQEWVPLAWWGGGVVTPVSPQATPMSPRVGWLSWQRHLLAVPPSLGTSSLRTGFVKDQHHQAGLGRTGWEPEASFGGLMPLAPPLAPGLTPWLCRQVVTN